MAGLLLKLIDTLLGTGKTEEERKKEGETERLKQKEAVRREVLSPAPQKPKTQTSESKDWVPEIVRRPSAQSYNQIPHQTRPETEKHTEDRLPPLTSAARPQEQKSEAKKETEPEKAQQKDKDKEKSKPTQQITLHPQIERSGIAGMIERAYNKAARTVAQKLRSQEFIITGPIIIAAIVLILSFTPFFSYVKAFLIVIAFIIIAAISKLTQKVFPFVVGFDLCLFFTVLAGIAYHPFVGMFVGVISSALGSVARGQYDMDKVIVPLLGYIIVSLLLPVMPFTGLFTIGMVSAVIYAILMSIIFGITMGASPVIMLNTATFFATSVGFNYWLFANYGAGLLSMMSL